MKELPPIYLFEDYDAWNDDRAVFKQPNLKRKVKERPPVSL